MLTLGEAERYMNSLYHLCNSSVNQQLFKNFLKRGNKKELAKDSCDICSHKRLVSRIHLKKKQKTSI